MAFNKNNSKAVSWISFFFLLLGSSPGTSMNNMPLTEDAIVEGSLADTCLKTLKKFCGVMPRDTVTALDCLQEGVTDYPKEPNPPDYIVSYFEFFRISMDTSKFELPEEYCYQDAFKAFEAILDSEYYLPMKEDFDRQIKEHIMGCLEGLKVFIDKMDAESEEKSRYNILCYMLYESRMADTNSFHADYYYSYARDSVAVKPGMLRPMDYCMLKYSNNKK